MEQPSREEVKGLLAVSQALKYESFPAAKSELYYSIGDIEVQDSKGTWYPVRDILDRIGMANFTSPEGVIEEMRTSLGLAHRAA